MPQSDPPAMRGRAGISSLTSPLRPDREKLRVVDVERVGVRTRVVGQPEAEEWRGPPVAGPFKVDQRSPLSGRNVNTDDVQVTCLPIHDPESLPIRAPPAHAQ